MTCLEDLSNEMIYEIFEYLDYYDAYDTFFRLNIRFQNLFIHCPIPLHLNLSKVSKKSFDQYFQFIIKGNENRIQSINISNPFYTEYLLRFLSINSSFLCLQTLSIRELHSHKLIPFLHTLQSIPYLKSLTITTNGLIQNLDCVHQLILSLPVLNYCNTSFNWRTQSLSPLIFSNVRSSIKHLIIDSPYDLESFVVLLACLPELVRLSCYRLICEETMDVNRFVVSSKLTHLHLTLSMEFNQFREFILNFVHSLEVLSISSLPMINGEDTLDHFDTDYLNASRWESLISTRLPHLRTFHLQCFGKINQQDHHHKTSIMKFDSIFWITRAWIFAHQYYEYDHSTWLIFRSIHSHKYYSPFGLHQINISNPLASIDYTCRSSQLILTGESYKTNFSIVQLSTLIPLSQITELVVNCDAFLMNDLLNLLENSPNIHRLKLLADSRCVRFGEDFSTRYITESVNGSEMAPRGLLAVKHVELILQVCPRLQSFELNINENFLEGILRLVLAEKISRNHQLCLLGFRDAHHGIIRRLNRMLTIENLLEQYSIEYIQNTVYLWW